jgi:two-component system, OmpR family, response regulator
LNDTILIVDDSSFIVDGLVAILKKKYRTLAAYSGEDCLAILRKEAPSIIILDVMMEPIDGWETLTRIRENPATRWTPVLMFSARKISREDAEKHLVRLDDFIQKPVSPKKIIESIEKVLARRRASREAIGVWKAAGVNPEAIEEYLTLTTSLEVDLSLCQNLRLHDNLANPPDGSQTELRSLLDAIEERIGEERSRIMAMEQEMNARAGGAAGKLREAVMGPGDAEPGSPPESTAGVPAVSVSSGNTAAGGGTGARDSLSAGMKEITKPATILVSEPVEVQHAGNPASPVNASRQPSAEPVGADLPPGLLQEDELFEEDPLVIQTGDELFDEPPGVSPTGPAHSREKNGSGSSLPNEERKHSPAFTGKPGPRPAPEPDRAGPDSRPGGIQPAFAFPGSFPEDSGTVPPSSGGPPGLHAAPPSHSDPAEHRHLVPAELDIPPIGSDEPLTGAGTDIPLPQERLRGRRRPTDQRPVVPAPPVQQAPAAERPAGGILARIIALFVRKKKP